MDGKGEGGGADACEAGGNNFLHGVSAGGEVGEHVDAVAAGQGSLDGGAVGGVDDAVLLVSPRTLNELRFELIAIPGVQSSPKCGAICNSTLFRRAKSLLIRKNKADWIIVNETIGMVNRTAPTDATWKLCLHKRERLTILDKWINEMF
jgi:hypothetical protein